MSLTDSPVTSDDLTATGTTHESATTTHAFSPGAGSTVVVLVEWMQGGSGTPTTVTVADSHGNSYTDKLAAANSFNVAGAGIFYFYYASAPGSTTLTVTSSAASSATGGTTFLVSPAITTGAGPTPSFGPNTISIAPSSSTTSLTGSLITTVSGSQVYLVGGAQSGSAGTANANTTQTAAFTSTNNAFTGLGKTQTGTPGATTFGWTLSPAAAFGGNLIGVELLPASSASNTRTAGLTVTPSFSAGRVHAAKAAAALTVAVVLTAAASGGSIPANALVAQDGNPFVAQDGGVLVAESSGSASTATASLTVTPSFGAAAQRGRFRSATLTVTPSFSAAGTGRAAGTATAALTVTPVLGAASSAAHVATASLTVTPSLGAEAAGVASASLTVTPVLGAAATRGQFRSAALTVTPVLGGAATVSTTAGLTVTPSFSAAAVRGRFRSASLTVTPVLSAGRTGAHKAAASLTVTPVLGAARVHGNARSASLTVTPRLTAAGTGVSGSPPAYPDGDVAAMVELLLGGTWTDITDAALPDGTQYGSIKTGQADGSQQPSPGAMNGTWDNPDYSLSPRNTAGPYFGQLRQNTPARVSVGSTYGGYLRLENDDSDRAFVADTAALHVTGSMELRIEARPSDYRGCVLAARYDNTQPSWFWTLDRAGTFTFTWFDSGGTQHSVTSPGAAAVSWTAFRVTLDVTTGTVEHFVTHGGIDGTWTSLGSASGTSGAATTVRAGNAPLVVGWAANLDSSQMRGQVSGFRLYSGIGGTKVADAQFSIQVPGVTTWTDPEGLSWNLAGGAELTVRDYRLHGELASLAPTAHQSSSLPRLTAQLAGRMRRLQQGYAPTLDSPMRRAILSQAGSLVPVNYWPMEDGIVSKAFGPAIGTHLLTEEFGLVKPAADSSFEASAPLPTLQADQLSFTVDTYTGGTAWAVRFLLKRGSTLPATGTSARLIEINTTGACTKLQVLVNDDGTLNFKGFLSGGTAAWTETAEEGFPQNGVPAWWSVECTTVSGGVQYALVALAPGAALGNSDAHTVTGHGSFGNVTSGTVNPDLALTDTVFGHLTVQKSWVSLFSLGQPLNAWRTELTADRFARICDEQGITCRIIGRPSVTQAMGPQPRGSAWTVLFDCANTEQGLLYEPMGCFGLGLRTAESLGVQSPAVTLDFTAANLRGDLQPVDDDSAFLNDLTAAIPNGTQYRVTLDDGTANSVSDPKDGGRGAYAGQPPFSFNLADASQLAGSAALYLARVSVDEARYRNVVGDFGVPGAPVADMARLRPGDLIKITGVPGIYQTADIQQLATGATEAFGPGRVITWNGVPFSPYVP